jgi:hypothetical protein
MRLEDRETIAKNLHTNSVDIVLAGHVHQSCTYSASQIGPYSHPAQNVASTASQILAPEQGFSLIDFYANNDIGHIAIHGYRYSKDFTNFQRIGGKIL